VERTEGRREEGRPVLLSSVMTAWKGGREGGRGRRD